MENKARQDKARQDKTRHEHNRQDKTRQDKTAQGKAPQNTRQDKTGQDRTRQGTTTQHISVSILTQAHVVSWRADAERRRDEALALVSRADLFIEGLALSLDAPGRSEVSGAEGGCS